MIQKGIQKGTDPNCIIFEKRVPKGTDPNGIIFRNFKVYRYEND